MTSTPIRILLADDHEVFLDGLTAVLSQEGFEVVARASGGGQAVELFFETKPDLALLDLRMPDIGGIECIRRIRSRAEDAKIALFSTFDRQQDISQAMEAGARGYLVKDIPRSKLVLALQEIYRGGTCLTPGLSASLLESIRRVPLTAREQQVLQLLTAGHANKTIAADLNIAEGTVKLHIYKLYQKLGVRSRTEAMRVALKRGLTSLSV